MRGMDAAPHRVWRYAVLAWFALIAGPTAHAAIRWQMGFGRDVDMSGVHELVLVFVIVFAAPMAALAFGVFAPLAVALDYIVNGRTPRFVNLLLGAMLSGPALIVTVMVAGWPMRGSASAAVMLVATLLLAGMIVGLGVRHRRSTEHDRLLRS
jgi:hypothetical protein